MRERIARPSLPKLLPLPGAVLVLLLEGTRSEQPKCVSSRCQRGCDYDIPSAQCCISLIIRESKAKQLVLRIVVIFHLPGRLVVPTPLHGRTIGNIHL
jgi:hypothetical protein